MSPQPIPFPSPDEDAATRVLLALEPDDAPAGLLLALEPDAAQDKLGDAMPTVVDVRPAGPVGDAMAAAVSLPLVELLGKDVDLPALIRFVPDFSLKTEAEKATAYALGVTVTGPEGLQRADVALTALRTSLDAIRTHFEEPAKEANKVHKAVTNRRSEWLADGENAVKTVGQRIATEKNRLEAIANEERRRIQAEADRKAREDAAAEAKLAEASGAPETVVQEMTQRAQTATAPPVATSTYVPRLAGSTTVTTWKARLASTTGDREPNPDIEKMTPAEVANVHELLKAILDGKAPIRCIAIDWSYCNARAKADKSTLNIPGLTAFSDNGTRAKGRR